jgi:hypothetical protein
MPTSGVMGADNVDRRLLPRFEASIQHERARRELLPPVWLNADRGPAEDLGDLFDAVLERARERVRSQRAETVGDVPEAGVTNSALFRDTPVRDLPIP